MSKAAEVDLFRRARQVAQAVEEARDEEIWVLPACPVTDEQMARVLRLIDAEGEKS